MILEIKYKENQKKKKKKKKHKRIETQKQHNKQPIDHQKNRREYFKKPRDK